MRRSSYVALAVVTVVIGLIVHRGSLGFTDATRDKAGDALWGAMMLWLVSVVAPFARRWVRAAIAAVICASVELSQLYHGPAMDAARNTTAGRLILGSGFDAGDLAAYAAGILMVALLERAVARARSSRSLSG